MYIKRWECTWVVYKWCHVFFFTIYEKKMWKFPFKRGWGSLSKSPWNLHRQNTAILNFFPNIFRCFQNLWFFCLEFKNYSDNFLWNPWERKTAILNLFPIFWGVFKNLYLLFGIKKKYSRYLWKCFFFAASENASVSGICTPKGYSCGCLKPLGIYMVQAEIWLQEIKPIAKLLEWDRKWKVSISTLGILNGSTPAPSLVTLYIRA